MKWIFNYIVLAIISVLSLGLTNVQPVKFSGKVKLIKKTISPHCGVIAWASKQKFEVIGGDIPRGTDNIIFIKIRCPEFLGKDFFKENRIYNVELSKVLTSPFNYTVLDENIKDQFPEYWSESITISETQ